MTSSSLTEAQSGPKIQIGKVDSITIYEVTESELAALEAGSPTGYLFDAFIALFVLATSFLITVTTVDIKSDRLFSVFMITLVASYVGSLVCLCLWLRFRKAISQTLKAIKMRVQPPSPSNSVEPTVKE